MANVISLNNDTYRVVISSIYERNTNYIYWVLTFNSTSEELVDNKVVVTDLSECPDRYHMFDIQKEAVEIGVGNGVMIVAQNSEDNIETTEDILRSFSYSVESVAETAITLEIEDTDGKYNILKL